MNEVLVLASDFESSREVIDQGVTGFLAKNNVLEFIIMDNLFTTTYHKILKRLGHGALIWLIAKSIMLMYGLAVLNSVKLVLSTSKIDMK